MCRYYLGNNSKISGLNVATSLKFTPYVLFFLFWILVWVLICTVHSQIGNFWMFECFWRNQYLMTFLGGVVQRVYVWLVVKSDFKKWWLIPHPVYNIMGLKYIYMQNDIFLFAVFMVCQLELLACIPSSWEILMRINPIIWFFCSI